MIPLPEIVRPEPSRPIVVRYVALGAAHPADPATGMEERLRLAGLEPIHSGSLLWTARLAGRTRVWGLVPREVEETVEVSGVLGPEGAELRVSVLPSATHDAHAAGVAGALILGVTAWLAGGWLAGIPAGLATLLAGGLWADVSRTLAFDALEARLRGVAYDLGRAAWPDAPGQLLPSRGPSRLLWRRR